MVEYVNHIRVAGHDPRVQKWIPVNGIFVTQLVIERIGIGQNFGIKEMVKAQNFIHLLWRDVRCNAG
jgi:hypothetical protein